MITVVRQMNTQRTTVVLYLPNCWLLEVFTRPPLTRNSAILLDTLWGAAHCRPRRRATAQGLTTAEMQIGTLVTFANNKMLSPTFILGRDSAELYTNSQKKVYLALRTSLSVPMQHSKIVSSNSNTIQFIYRSHQLKHHKTHNNKNSWRDLNGMYRAQNH